MEQSIHVLLVDRDEEFDGLLVGVVTKDVTDHLTKLVSESEQLLRKADKLREKSAKAKRHANKLLQRLIASHGIKFNEKTEAVGVAKESGSLYVGERSKIIANSEAEPTDGDRVVGTITKYERRKYNEEVDNYNFLANQVLQHNDVVSENEKQLIAFEQNILGDNLYDREKQFLIVSTISGKVYLSNIKETE